MKNKRKSPRHCFRFKTLNTSGKLSTIEAWAIVKKANRSVQLTLTADDVRRSMQLGGVGNTQTCSMAVCANRQADAFPHHVEGYIDWQYSTCYVVTKVGKNGLPSECVVYKHNDTIAKLNDSKGGQAKLLAQLEKCGERTIHLRPSQKKRQCSPKPEGQRTGARSSRPVEGVVGAKLRFAVAQLGGV